MSAVTDTGTSKAQALIASQSVRGLVERLVRRRVPAVEVDDVVQTVLCAALASDGAPEDEESLRKWIVGIARHKVADLHRQGSRRRQVELPAQIAGEAPPHSAREWARWAEQQAGDDDDAKRTLRWMAREGAGEKLAHIAQSERLPATQVRQRVSRMRRFMKQRWVAELAAVAGVGLLVLVAWYLLREPEPTAGPQPGPVPELSPLPQPRDPRLDRAQQLRADALRECERQAWQRCVAGLDEAARLDPLGDDDDLLRSARQRALDALTVEQRQDNAPPAPGPTSVLPDNKSSLPGPKPGPYPKLERDLLKKQRMEQERRHQAPHRPAPTSQPPQPPPPAPQQSTPNQQPPPAPTENQQQSNGPRSKTSKGPPVSTGGKSRTQW